MDYESKFLEEEYLETRLRDFKDIKNGIVKFKIGHSDRPYSKTLYIYFYVNGNLRSGLRVSDHEKESVYLSFLVNADKILGKKKKEQFIRNVETCIKKAKLKQTYKTIEFLQKRAKENEQDENGHI